MYKHGMEDSDLLLDIVLHCFKMKKKGFNYIRALSKIPSIDMLVMMLSKIDREVFIEYIEGIIQWCRKEKDSNHIRHNFRLFELFPYNINLSLIISAIPFTSVGYALHLYEAYT